VGEALYAFAARREVVELALLVPIGIVWDGLKVAYKNCSQTTKTSDSDEGVCHTQKSFNFGRV
jgi:hypothetical protein